MEEGNQKKRNVRPVEKSKLPFVTLLILTGLVVALLYVGYEYLKDDTGSTKELTDMTPDTTREVVSLDVYAQPSLAEPEQIDSPQIREESGTSKKAVSQSSAPASVPTEGQSYTHKVKQGETLFSVASRYNLKVETLKSLNPSARDNTALKAGEPLKVQVQAIHTVGPGDILRVVAGKYGITVEQLMKANNKSKNFAQRGEKLVIPFKNKI